MDEGIFGILLAPIIIFMIFVAPIWLILHYRSKKHATQGLSSQEQAALKEMSIKAEVMSERIETLEAILDKEAPDWRQKA